VDKQNHHDISVVVAWIFDIWWSGRSYLPCIYITISI